MRYNGKIGKVVNWKNGISGMGGRDGEMLTLAWPKIDTEGSNGKTDRCAKNGRNGKIGKMVKPAGRKRKW